MKSELIKLSTQWIKNLRGIRAGLITFLIFFRLLAKAWSVDLFWEDSAATPGTANAPGFVGTWATGLSDWSSTPKSNTNTPWVDGSVAHFLGSGWGIVFLESPITAAGINFDPGANPLIIETNGFTLTVDRCRDREHIGEDADDHQQRRLHAIPRPIERRQRDDHQQRRNGRRFRRSTLFFDSSDGGTARAVTNGNGSFDISGLTTTGMNIGSVEGTGNYFLGSKTLAVGGNNLSTTVSGVIQDGGSRRGTGGSLTKVGTGTLTLSGANTYSGGTTIKGGTLVAGRADTITEVLPIAIRSRWVPETSLYWEGLSKTTSSLTGVPNAGHALAIHVGGNYSQGPNGTLALGIGGLEGEQYHRVAAGGDASLDATLVVTSLNKFHPSAGDAFEVVSIVGTVTGTSLNP